MKKLRHPENYAHCGPMAPSAGADHAELLDRVMDNSHRVNMCKAFFFYPWFGSGERLR
jgi:anaerobic magnesium-protoporphyrin IX monomethyl ester cyclase